MNGRAAFWLVILGLQGCAAVSTADGRRLALTSSAFRAYAEAVFRTQNRAADELAFLLDASAPSPTLEAAEQALLEACAGVNELATARRDDRRLGLRRSSQAARSVPACERATAAAMTALAEAAAN